MTAFAVPPEVTVNALVGAVVDESGLLYVNVTYVPAVLTDAERKIGFTTGVTAVEAGDDAEVAAGSVFVAVTVNV